jgi:hypothetical protein
MLVHAICAQAPVTKTVQQFLAQDVAADRTDKASGEARAVQMVGDVERRSAGKGSAG